MKMLFLKIDSDTCHCFQFSVSYLAFLFSAKNHSSICWQPKSQHRVVILKQWSETFDATPSVPATLRCSPDPQGELGGTAAAGLILEHESAMSC